MDWKVILIGLIPLAVWILSTIFRGIEEEEQVPPRARDPQGRLPRGSRRPQTELERFLEEARRRREAAPPRQVEASLPTLPISEPVSPPPPPPPPPLPPAPRAPSATVADSSPAPRTPSKRTNKPRQSEPAVDPAPRSTSTRPEKSVEVTIAPAPSLSKPKPPEALQRILNMLRDKESVKAALVLREIFDRPLSLR